MFFFAQEKTPSKALGLKIGELIRVRCIGQDVGGRYVLSRKPFLAINQRTKHDTGYTQAPRRVPDRQPLPHDGRVNGQDQE